VGFGIADDGVTVTINAERIHVPRRRRANGTVTFGTVEVRFGRTRTTRFSSYSLIAVGHGVSSPNEIGYSPLQERIRNSAKLLVLGVGTNRNVREHLAIFADGRIAFIVEKDVLWWVFPIRAGLAYRF